ncbi:MAG: SpoIIE family protein phosphatase [Actinomycetota bacterium]
MNYQWAAGSHRGRIRGNNEDAYSPEASGRGSGPVLVMVADGMGGAVGGEIASHMAVEEANSDHADLVELIARANRVIWERAVAEPGLAGMGTTMTLMELDPGGTASLGHVGDSRAYLWRSGELTQLTRDHTVVAEHLAAGRITENDVATHPQRSMLTRVLGLEPVVEVDTFDLHLEPGDRILLCSDGLTNMVADPVIAALLSDGPPEEAVWSLIEQANRAGGHDNITVVVVAAEP